MTHEPASQLMTTLQFSATLPDAVRDALAGIAHQQTFQEGEFLCREGETTHELFLIVSGRVGLEMLVPGRGQVRLLTLGPGEIVAWSAIVGSHGATASAVATEVVETLAFSRTELLDLCQTNHDVGFLVMRELAKSIAQRLVVTRLQLLDLFEEQSAS